jgi:hypothetical protein
MHTRLFSSIARTGTYVRTYCTWCMLAYVRGVQWSFLFCFFWRKWCASELWKGQKSMYVEYSGAERPQRHRSSTRVPLGEYVLLASPWPVGMTTHGSEGGVLRTPYAGGWHTSDEWAGTRGRNGPVVSRSDTVIDLHWCSRTRPCMMHGGMGQGTVYVLSPEHVVTV